jgi:hypothetical protein
MSLVQSKYLCNIIIHTLMYTCTIKVYMHTDQVCSYVCSRPKLPPNLQLRKLASPATTNM